MNEPTGTTTSFGFLGFFTSLFPRIWPLAIVMLLSSGIKKSGWVCTPKAIPAQLDHRPLSKKATLYIYARIASADPDKLQGIRIGVTAKQGCAA